MAEIKTLICDVCGTPDATAYSIGRRPGAPWIIDLCAECAEPITEWQKKGRAPAGKKRPYRKYGTKIEVVETTTYKDEKVP